MRCSPGSVLGPLLFIIYTTPLSSVISSLNQNHQFYADDTPLFYSFYPSDYDSTITHLQNALEHISSWMTANRLTLNSSKTEFLLIGNRQLTKIHNTLFAILASSLMNISLSLTKSLHCLNLVIITFVNFVVFVRILIIKQLVPLPPPLFALNLITATPYTSVFLSLRQTVSRSFRILLLMLLLKPPNPVVSHLHLNLCTGSK